MKTARLTPSIEAVEMLNSRLSVARATVTIVESSEFINMPQM